MCILWQMSSHNSAVSSRTNLNSCGEFTVIIYCYQLVGRLCCTHSLIHPTRADIIPICWFYTYLRLLFLRARIHWRSTTLIRSGHHLSRLPMLPRKIWPPAETSIRPPSRTGKHVYLLGLINRHRNLRSIFRFALLLDISGS